MTDYIVVGHFMVVMVSIVLLCARFQVRNSALFLNYSTYLIVFGIFYISLPSIITTVTGVSLVGSSKNTIEYAAIVGLYFNCIFFLFFYFSTKKPSHIFEIQPGIAPTYKLFAIAASAFIGLYVLFFLLKDAPQLMDIYNNRRLQANYDNLLIQTFKVYFFSKIQIICISFLILTTKNMKYLGFFAPFLVLDIVLSGRDLIFSFMVLAIVLSGLLQRNINIAYLLGVTIVLLLMGVLRSNNVLEWSDAEMAVGEFMYTWTTTHLIIESDAVNDWQSMFVFSSFKIFPGGTYEALFGPYKHYHHVIVDGNPFLWGLAGSVVSEALSFKSYLAIMVVPLIMVAYGCLINSLLRINLVFTKILFLLSILYIHPIVRFTFFEHILYPFYLVLFFGFWIIFYDLRRLYRQ